MNRVGFSGTRKGCRKAQHAALKDVLGRELAEEGAVLHSGDCVGCDEEAFMAAASLGRKNVLHPPEVGTLRAFCDRLDIVADIETLPARFRGMASRQVCTVFSSSLAVISVSINPGATAFDRMPREPNSRAMDLVNPMIPALEAA
jgi:hypothetical protein